MKEDNKNDICKQMNEPEDDILSINVSDSILVSESIIVEIIIERITVQKVKREDGLVVSVEEYRQLLGDQISTEEDIVKRLRYLESFCANIIKLELNKTYE